MLSMFRSSAPTLARRPADAAPVSSLAAIDVHPVLRLQQTLGNRAVQRLLHRGEEEPQAAPDAPTAETTEAPTEAPAAQAAQPPLGHAPAPPGMAACPEVPPRKSLTATCPSTSSAPLELPVLSAGRFGGDPDRARFAQDLARCRAARVVKREVQKRYQADLAQAKKQATEDAKVEKAAAVQAAIESLDPKDLRAIKRAKARAAVDAERAAKEKIAAAVAAVTRQDPAQVEDELAAAYEQWYAADYALTLQGALNRYGKSWKNIAQARLDRERKKIARQKSAKPKVAKGQTPPPAKTAEQVAAEIEAEMLPARCKQEEWLLNRLEAVGFAWAVGRREQADFLTIPQKAAYMKDFSPAYQSEKKDWVEIPDELKVTKKKMPGIAPEVADFLKRLAADPATPRFQAGNYGGHGIGAWKNNGFSLDLFLQGPLDRRGFYEPAKAVDFLLSVDRTAKAMGARWRVVYDDFVVAQKVNSVTGSRNVGFQGSLREGRLNWHGPDPLILHFHLDLEVQRTLPAEEPLSDGGVCEAPDALEDAGVCWGEP